MITEIVIEVNGQQEFLPESPYSLATLLNARHISLDKPGIAIAINGTIVRRSEWTNQLVHANDKIEIVTARQGG